MSAGTGPTRETGPGRLNQLAYQPGDTLLCCGCPLGTCYTVTDCDCRCHDVARMVRSKDAS